MRQPRGGQEVQPGLLGLAVAASAVALLPSPLGYTDIRTDQQSAWMYEGECFKKTMLFVSTSTLFSCKRCKSCLWNAVCCCKRRPIHVTHLIICLHCLVLLSSWHHSAMSNYLSSRRRHKSVRRCRDCQNHPSSSPASSL
jgi:hypothetical protein